MTVIAPDPVVTHRKNETEKIVLPPFPTIANLRSWRNEMGKNLVAESGHHDTREIAWVGEVVSPGQSFDALADSGETRLHSLDLRLSAALTLIIRNCTVARSLHDDLLVREERAQEVGTMLRGRQILSLMYE